MRPPITKNIGKELVPPSILPRADVPLTIDATVDKDLGIVQDRLINIKDTRKVRRTTGQPLKPTERRAGNIPEGLIKDIVGYAKNYGINPYEAISRAIIESEGNPTYNNPFHLLYNPESNPAISKIKDSYRSGVEAGIVALKQKEKEFKNLVKKGKIAPRPPDKMEMLKLQMYNGLGRIFPDTEGATGWMYGIKIPKEGIKMTENPLYAKELLDIMDVVKLNPNVKTIVEQAKPITKTTQYGPLKNQDYENYFTGPEFFASGGPVYNWIPPNYPRVGARNEQGGWLDQYADGGDVPHDYMYSQGNVSSYRPGTSIHPIGMTNVPDSPCGPGFTIQYDETGNPVCMPIAELGPLAGASQMDYDLFNPAVYNQSPLETYSEEYSTRVRGKRERPAKEEREDRQSARKAIKASKLHRRPFLFGIRQGFKKVGDAIQRCLPGDDCYKFEDGSWVTDSSIPTPTTPSSYPAYPDRTLTNYQMGTPKAPMYAHGATVWTKQTTPSWVAGTPTRTTTQRITPQRAQSPGTQVPYPEIKITGPTDPYSPSSPPVLQGYNPYKGPMRLHAPDTRRMAYGGYVPMYKSGGFLRQAGEFAFGALEGTLDTVTGGLTDSLTDMAHDALADAADTTYDDKAGQRLKRLHGAGKIGGAITGGIVSGNVAGAISQGAEGGQDILQASPNASEDLKKWGGLGLNLAKMGSGFMGGANNPTQMANFNASDIGKFAGQAGKAGQGFNMFQSGNVMGMMNMFQPQGMGSFRNGSYVTSKYNPPGLRWQQLNPGVSAPEGVYTGPTSQRGITFADGGDVLPYITSNRAEYEKRQDAFRDSSLQHLSGERYADLINMYERPIHGTNAISRSDLERVRNILYNEFPGLNTNRRQLNPQGSYDYYVSDVDGSIIGPLESNIYAKPKQKVIFNPDISKIPMRGLPSDNIEAMPQKVNVPESNPLPTQYMDTRGEFSNVPQTPPVYSEEQLLKMGYRKPVYKQEDGGPVYNWIPEYPRTGAKSAQGGWLDMYDEGGEVDITKPYLNPAVVQATLASASKPVTNTLGQVISTPASREKERREKVIAKNPSKYSIEDYKQGIKEPGLEDATLEAIDALSMLSGAGYLGKKGVELGVKEIGKGVKNLIYKGVDPLFYNPTEKIKSFVPNILGTEKDKIKRVEKIMRDSGVRGSYRKAQNRLDAWRVGLGLPQKYNTFKKTGENTFAINPEFFRLEPNVQQSIIAHVKAFNLKDKYLNNVITPEQYEKGLVNINKKMHNRLGDTFLGKYVKEENIPFLPEAIVERKGDKGFSMYDQDRYAGVMGGFRWDVEDLPDNKMKLIARDTWDLHPFDKRGVTKFSDRLDGRQKKLNKGYIPALKNVEMLRLVGGKPYNIENTFIVDKLNPGGWLDNL